MPHLVHPMQYIKRKRGICDPWPSDAWSSGPHADLVTITYCHPSPLAYLADITTIVMAGYFLPIKTLISRQLLPSVGEDAVAKHCLIL